MLDVSVRADIINMLIDLARNHDASVVFISHDIALTRYISDHVAVMYLGKVVEYGTADEVINNPKHPYTKALLSAVPQPDPEVEKKKKLLVYDPSVHDYSVDKPVWEEILPGHFVYGNQKELEQYRKEIANTPKA